VELLVEVSSASQSHSLNKINNLAGCPATASPYRTLNTCKGVICCRALIDEDEILDELKSQGVTDIYNILTKDDSDNRRNTNTFIITFHTAVFFYNATYVAWAPTVRISILLADADPTADCLQETFLTADKTIKFNNYTTYYMPAVEANGTPHGGLALLIKNGTPHSQISLNTSLQAIALRYSSQSYHSVARQCELL